ncbi:hypothetical protein DL95DRAFT_403507 [Leptodontidium sp. 2 PMI_412]|nr:hypothetical protein DL95DRAFT_403507 [Leptodontidium sp. 2 PMI_412]
MRKQDHGSLGPPSFNLGSNLINLQLYYAAMEFPAVEKTVLVSSVADHFMAVSLSSQTPLAYHYYDHAEKRSLTPIAVIGALARALLECIEIPAELAQTIATAYGDGGRTPDTKDVLQILTSAIERFESVVIIIDGIDEVADEDRTQVCGPLKALVTEVQVPVKLFISCREDILPSVCAHDATSFRVQISEIRISTDNEDYISHSVSDLIGSGELAIRMIVNTLVEEAKGVFLWVKFQLNELCIAETDDAIKSTLQDLPKDLSETCDRLLGRIEGKQRRKLVNRMFQ